MTTSPEEKALLADAYEVNKERRELDSANTAAAIQRGLAEARTSRSSKRRRGQWIAVLCAVSLAVAGIMFASLGDLGQQRLTSSEPEVHWGDWSLFVDCCAQIRRVLPLPQLLTIIMFNVLIRR